MRQLKRDVAARAAAPASAVLLDGRRGTALAALLGGLALAGPVVAQEGAPEPALPRPTLPEPLLPKPALPEIIGPGAPADLTAPGAPADPGDLAGDLEGLFEELARPDADHEAAADRIADLWSRSGSASADLLLRRGREAIEAGDHQAAIEHLTALTDHAPGFAEGWSARATAFYAAGRTGESLADILRTLEIEPRHFGALAGLGFIMEDLGYERDALRAYRAAAALHPEIEMVNDAIEHLERTIEGEAL